MHSAMHLLNAVSKYDVMIGAVLFKIFEQKPSDPTEFLFFNVSISLAYSISVTRYKKSVCG